MESLQTNNATNSILRHRKSVSRKTIRQKWMKTAGGAHRVPAHDMGFNNVQYILHENPLNFQRKPLNVRPFYCCVVNRSAVIILPFFASSVSCAIFSKFEKAARLSNVFAGFFIVQK